MLVTSIFSFSHIVFKTFLFQRCFKSGLCGTELNNKILDWIKFKAFADDKLDIARIIISLFDTVENIEFSLSYCPLEKLVPVTPDQYWSNFLARSWMPGYSSPLVVLYSITCI